MKIFVKVFLILLILTKTPPIFSQQLSKSEKEVLILQDKRNLGENENLLKYLESPGKKIRHMALYALANIADSNSVYKTAAFLSGLYKEENVSDLLKEYSFYLGQTMCSESKRMLTLIFNTDNKNILLSYPEIINSLGRIGDEKDMDRIIKISLMQNNNDIDSKRESAMSIGRFALRKIKNENSILCLKELFYIKDSIVQRNTAFALWRTGDKSLLDTAKQEIYTLAQSTDPQTRMWAYNAMGKLQDKSLLMLLLESYRGENDWRVQVNMLNSLTNFNLDSLTDLTKQLYSVLGTAIGDKNEHVSLTALSVLGKLFTDGNKLSNETAKFLLKEIKSNIIYSIDSVDEISWRQRSELANTLSLIFRDEVKDDLLSAYSRTNDYNLKSGIVKAFGNFNDGMVYREVRDTISADVQRYNAKNPDTTGNMIGSKDLAILYRGFIEMLSNLQSKAGMDEENNMRLIFTEFAGSKDPLLTDICLNALKDSLYMKYREETSSVLMFDYNELEYPKDIDVNLIFIDAMKELHNENTIKALEENLNSDNYEIAKASSDALEEITGKKYQYSALPKYDFDWNYINGLSQKQFITVKTNKGNIKIMLLPDAAPFTVMNFLKLAEKNYYDGTIFHRVVSNFVIQGGDPTGTGYGGPGYSIRSEFSPLTFETGIVGMASSGKDTEGSQFFITHSSTPHLDGKYTIFGKVAEGMDVVDKIMVGDYIEDIIISP